MAPPHEALPLNHRRRDSVARPLRDAFHLPALDASVSEARRRVLDKLHEWGVAEESREDAQLLVSELFTNAVRHTDSEKVSCELWVIGIRLRLEITDEGGSRPLHPLPQAVSTEGEGGRGLLLVSVLADEWGVRRDDGQGQGQGQGQGEGHSVWAELPCVRTPH